MSNLNMHIPDVRNRLYDLYAPNKTYYNLDYNNMMDLAKDLDRVKAKFKIKAYDAFGEGYYE